MKKSKIYASVALAALLAGCSNEDFISNEQTSGLEGRPMTKVELAFDEADTRLDWAKPEGEGWQWTFQDGDKIGALLMDTWNIDDCGIGHFNLTDYVHTNYPFVRTTKDGKTTWNTPEDAAVCEGNYFFYFPYDKTFTHRGLVGWSVNPDQLNYNPETGEYFPMQAIKDNQKWLGYKFIEHQNEGVNKVNFDFVPLFATPKFVFENRTGGELKIERLVIRDFSDTYEQDNGSINEINPAGASQLLATSAMLAPKTGNFDKVNKTWEGQSYQRHTALMWKYAQRYINLDAVYPFEVKADDHTALKAEPSTKVWALSDPNNTYVDREATYEYTVDFGDNYKVGHMGDVVARLVMPGGQYRTGEAVFEALLYVCNESNGKHFVVRMNLGNPQTAGGTNHSGWDDILAGAASNNLKPGIMNVYEASFNASALQSYEMSDFKVATTAELEWILEQATKKAGQKYLGVTTFGKKVEMSKKLYDMLAAHPEINLQINGHITLVEGLPEDAINKLYFDNENMTTYLHIQSKQVANEWKWVDGSSAMDKTSKTLTNCEIFVDKNGELDTKKNGIDIIAPVYNEGNVRAGLIKGDVENKGNMWVDTVEGDILNSGNLNVYVQVKGNVENTATGIAGIASTTEDILNNGTMFLTGSLYEGKVVNNGTMTISGKSKFTHAVPASFTAADAALTNNATLNINADVESVNRVWFINTEDAEATIADGVKVIMHRTDNYGTINVGEGAILTPDKNYPGNVINYVDALINNNGTMHNVVNNGLIVTGENSITNVTDGKGTIDNSAMGEISYNDDQTAQFIVADVTGISLETLNNNVIKADANQLIIKKGTIEVKDDFDLNGGSKTCEKRGFFGKGVFFGDVKVNAPMDKRLAVYTNEFTVTGTTEIVHGELAILKEAQVGTIATINGELNVHNYGTFRGGMSAKLTLKFPGKVHNQGTVRQIENASACNSTVNNHWTGNAAE